MAINAKKAQSPSQPPSAGKAPESDSVPTVGLLTSTPSTKARGKRAADDEDVDLQSPTKRTVSAEPGSPRRARLGPLCLPPIARWRRTVKLTRGA